MIQISYTSDTSMQRQLMMYLAQMVKGGTYHQYGLHVLPYLEDGDPTCVHFPDLGYTHDFWSSIGEQHARPAVIDRSRTIVVPVASYTPGDSDMSLASQRIVRTFVDLLCEHMPRLTAQVEQIRVIMTELGTRGSYEYAADSRLLTITYRTDLDSAYLMDTILQACVLLDHTRPADRRAIAYLERQAVVRFARELAILQPYISLPPYHPPDLARVLRDSQTYLTRLGYAPVADWWTEAILLSHLSPQERTLLDLLVLRRDRLVTFDEVGDALWGSDPDGMYSPATMAKLVQTLRSKIAGIGIRHEVIHTLRKRGYMLVG